MKGDVLLGEKFENFISSSIWISIKNFPTHEVCCLYFAMLQEIPQQAPQQHRPKPKDFHDKHFFSQCSNISKQGVYTWVAGNEVIVKNVNANIPVSLSCFLLPFLAFLCFPAAAQFIASSS